MILVLHWGEGQRRHFEFFNSRRAQALHVLAAVCAGLTTKSTRFAAAQFVTNQLLLGARR